MTYLVDAINRVECGDATAASHIAGMFGRAARDFEKVVRSQVGELLLNCGLNYDREIRPAINGHPPFAKLTLGNCTAVIKKASVLKPACVVAVLPRSWTADAFVETLKGINRAWVDLKHGDDIDHRVLLAEMKSMLIVHVGFKVRKGQSLGSETS